MGEVRLKMAAIAVTDATCDLVNELGKDWIKRKTESNDSLYFYSTVSLHQLDSYIKTRSKELLASNSALRNEIESNWEQLRNPLDREQNIDSDQSSSNNNDQELQNIPSKSLSAVPLGSLNLAHSKDGIESPIEVMGMLRSWKSETIRLEKAGSVPLFLENESSEPLALDKDGTATQSDKHLQDKEMTVKVLKLVDTSEILSKLDKMMNGIVGKGLENDLKSVKSVANHCIDTEVRDGPLLKIEKPISEQTNNDSIVFNDILRSLKDSIARRAQSKTDTRPKEKLPRAKPVDLISRKRVTQLEQESFAQYLARFKAFYGYKCNGKTKQLVNGLLNPLQRIVKEYQNKLVIKNSFHETILIIQRLSEVRGITIQKYALGPNNQSLRFDSHFTRTKTKKL